MPATPSPPHDRAGAMAPAALAMLTRCRKRPTLLRVQLLESLLALDAEKGGATVDQLYIHLQLRGAPVSVPSIYKVLAELVAAQAVDRHSVEQGPTVFVVRRSACRAHLVCTACQAVQSLDASALRKRLLAMADAEGFAVEDIQFSLRGRCRACAALQRPDEAATALRGAAAAAGRGQPR